MNKQQFKYQVLFIGDSISQPRVIGEYVSRMRASNKANKLDLDYGAYRHSVKRVELQSFGEPGPRKARRARGSQPIGGRGL